MDTQGRQQSSALSFHYDTQLPPPSIPGHNSWVSQRGLPDLPHHPPDPPRHALGENWMAEPSQVQLSRRVMQRQQLGHLCRVASAQAGSAQMPQAGLVPPCVTVAGQALAPSLLAPFLFLLPIVPASCPCPRGASSQTGGGEHKMTTSCHHHRAPGGRH